MHPSKITAEKYVFNHYLQCMFNNIFVLIINNTELYVWPYLTAIFRKHLRSKKLRVAVKNNIKAEIGKSSYLLRLNKFSDMVCIQWAIKTCQFIFLL